MRGLRLPPDQFVHFAYPTRTQYHVHCGDCHNEIMMSGGQDTTEPCQYCGSTEDKRLVEIIVVTSTPFGSYVQVNPS